MTVFFPRGYSVLFSLSVAECVHVVDYETEVTVFPLITTSYIYSVHLSQAILFMLLPALRTAKTLFFSSFSILFCSFTLFCLFVLLCVCAKI